MKQTIQRPVRILFIGDDLEFAALVEDFLQARGCEFTGERYRGRDSIQCLSGEYDLVLLDIPMTRTGGLALLRRFREQSNMPVMIITSCSQPELRIESLESGADDYVVKPFEPLELLARIRAILRRVEPRREIFFEIGANTFRLDPASRTVRLGRAQIRLTYLEFCIFEALVLRAGQVVSRDQIAQRLNGRDISPLDRSIDVHVSHLRKKLGRVGQRICTVRGVGYQFTTESLAIAQSA